MNYIVLFNCSLLIADFIEHTDSEIFKCMTCIVATSLLVLFRVHHCVEWIKISHSFILQHCGKEWSNRRDLALFQELKLINLCTFLSLCEVGLNQTGCLVCLINIRELAKVRQVFIKFTVLELFYHCKT